MRISLQDYIKESVSSRGRKGKYAEVSLKMNQFDLTQILTDIGAKEVGYIEMVPGVPDYYVEVYTRRGVSTTQFICNTTDKAVGFQVEFDNLSGELARVVQCNTKTGLNEIDRLPWVSPDESLELLKKMIDMMRR